MFGKDLWLRFSDNPKMAGKTKTTSVNHLRAWRESLEMSQTELATLIGTQSSVISELESGKLGLSDKWLRRLAPALKTRPGFLLDYHPDDVAAELLAAFNEIPEDDRPRALDVLKGFRRRA